jgi:inorganic pyrophosphatase
MQLNEIPPFVPDKDTINVVIETPRGSRNKYAFDSQLGAIKLKKVLPAGQVFPYDFGFVPRTRGEDGDPLDILVFMDVPAVAGCVIECRIVGVIKAEQTEEGKTERNDRLIGVASASGAFEEINDISDFEPRVIREIEAFFVHYNQMAGKEFKLLKPSGAKKAKRIIKDAYV